MFLQGSQEQPSIPVLALGAVQLVPLDVRPNHVRHQVANALPPPQGSPDLGGGNIICDPFFHKVNVILMSPQNIRFVDEFLNIISNPTDTHKAVFLHNFSDVL